MCYFIILRSDDFFRDFLLSGRSSVLSVETLRSDHSVRALRSEEEGTSLEHLPAGVYGFTYAPDQPTPPLFSKKNYHSFEVHKAGDGTGYLIGYVTSEEARDLETGKSGARVRLFPDAFGEAKSLVRVAISRIVTPKRMPRDEGNPLPFAIL